MNVELQDSAEFPAAIEVEAPELTICVTVAKYRVVVTVDDPAGPVNDSVWVCPSASGTDSTPPPGSAWREAALA